MIREHELKSHSNWGIYMHLIESIWNLKKNPEPAMVTMKPLDYTNPSGNFREKKKCRLYPVCVTPDTLMWLSLNCPQMMS